MRILRLSELTGIDQDLDDVIQELIEIEGAINALELAKQSGLTPRQFLKKVESRFSETEESETSEDLYALRRKLVLALAPHLGVTPPTSFPQ
jgi:hypothetical protein